MHPGNVADLIERPIEVHDTGPAARAFDEICLADGVGRQGCEQGQTPVLHKVQCFE